MINPEDTKIEINCRSVKAVLFYFEDKFGREELEGFISGTGMELQYLENNDNWVSYDYWCRLLAGIVEHTGDPNSPFDAGTYAAKRECFGSFQALLLMLGDPAGIYKLATSITPRYSKTGRCEMLELTGNKCSFAVRYFDGYEQDKSNCLNIQGIYASIPTLWGLPLAKVHESQCAAEGADSCVYHFTWRTRASRRFGYYGLLIGGTILGMAAVLTGLKGHLAALTALPLVAYFMGRVKDYRDALKESIDVNTKEGMALMQSIETIEDLNVDLQDKVVRRTMALDESNIELQNALTDLKKSQQQLVHSEKMATVGRLAAGMAHELNNPIGAVKNYIEDLLDDTPEGDPRRGRLQKAVQVTGRCGKIIDDLLTFARESSGEGSTDVGKVIENIVSSALEALARPGIRITTDVAADLPRMRVDSLQLQQAIMNIVMNAADAIEGEGEIHLSAAKDEESSDIVVKIADTGKGMSQEILGKIFDPFFTTREPGEGIGLGLAMSCNIVRRFSGDITVNSEEGRGTEFIVTLPLGEKSGKCND